MGSLAQDVFDKGVSGLLQMLLVQCGISKSLQGLQFFKVVRKGGRHRVVIGKGGQHNLSIMFSGGHNHIDQILPELFDNVADSNTALTNITGCRPEIDGSSCITWILSFDTDDNDPPAGVLWDEIVYLVDIASRD